MDVVLPDTGCNIITSSTSFYNYSDSNRTRQTYYIYEGTAFLQSTSYNPNGYSVTGTCLSTGALVYKPELQVYFPLIGFIFFSFILLLLYHIIIKRLLR